MDILFGILTGLLGLLLVFAGYYFARVLLPIWGFVAGLAMGGSIMADMSSTPFLGAATGILVGIALGLVFAALAYFYYYAAVIILVGALGYWIGSSFLLFLGLESGFLTFMTGLILGVVFALVGLALNMPRALLVIFTSITGAVLTVGGVLLIFNQIPLEAFSYSTARVVIANSTFWAIVAFALAMLGMVSQMITTQEFELDAWGNTDVHSHKKPPTTTPHPTNA